MSIDANKALIRRYIDELNRRNMAILDELVADRVVARSLRRIAAMRCSIVSRYTERPITGAVSFDRGR